MGTKFAESEYEMEYSSEGALCLKFPFEVNKSFLNGSGHPITIPTRFNDILTEKKISNTRDVMVCLPC